MRLVRRFRRSTHAAGDGAGSAPAGLLDKLGTLLTSAPADALDHVIRLLHEEWEARNPGRRWAEVDAGVLRDEIGEAAELVASLAALNLIAVGGDPEAAIAMLEREYVPPDAVDELDPARLARHAIRRAIARRDGGEVE